MEMAKVFEGYLNHLEDAEHYERQREEDLRYGRVAFVEDDTYFYLYGEHPPSPSEEEMELMMEEAQNVGSSTDPRRYSALSTASTSAGTQSVEGADADESDADNSDADVSDTYDSSDELRHRSAGIRLTEIKRKAEQYLDGQAQNEECFGERENTGA